uniref:(northern house mosquito) hypothetical protein n=1 Tax=Culex pipiens TaxID=7175 RepID=A0A8D8FQE0_CULPI
MESLSSPGVLPLLSSPKTTTTELSHRDSRRPAAVASLRRPRPPRWKTTAMIVWWWNNHNIKTHSQIKPGNLGNGRKNVTLGAGSVLRGTSRSKVSRAGRVV